MHPDFPKDSPARSILPGILISFLALNAAAEPPKPPEGFQWQPNPTFSDEFDGRTLDPGKWHDHHPRWRGRPPAKFIPEAVSVKDGMLQIRNRMLDQPDGRFTIGGGAVVSKSEDAFYGYYECRMKASSISMSSTFWMSNRGKKTKNGRIALELDIQETVGGPKRARKRDQSMGSNTHIWHNGKSYSKGNHVEVSPPTDEAFHTYGAWWVDAKTIHFYHNDKHVGTVHPDTRFSPTPFDQPMHLNMVTETYDWETPPTPEEVNNPKINTTYYDWVRAYTLVEGAEPLPYAELRKLRTVPRKWKAASGQTSELAKLVKVENGVAHLQKKDGKVVEVPVELLCAGDRHLLNRVLSSKHISP